MTTRISLRLMGLLCACCMMHVFASHSTAAPDIEWRTDYGKARHEAETKNLPLLIDVGTENCYYCKQLDMRTFKDPTLVAIVNERCIPLKIDADQHARLAEALRVQNYPTLVFASPEGKILGYQEGFIEADALQERLSKLFFSSGNAPTPGQELQEAKRAIANGDYSRAILLLKPIAENGKDVAMQGQARQLLSDLEKQAAGRCAEAKQLAESGKVPQAVETVTEILRVYPATRAAREGGQLLVTLASRAGNQESSRTRLAHEMLELAREDYRRQQYLSCLDRCEAISANYSDLNEGSEANKLAAEIKANPEWTKQACEQMGERLSNLYLTLAETWLKKGQPQQAIFYLERIVQTFPNSRNADIAQVRLAQIQGPGARVPDMKK